jgi:hypothetical protein
MRGLRPELWRQKNWLLYHDYAPSRIASFSGEFSTENNMTVVPTPPYPTLLAVLGPMLLFSFPRHVDTIDVIEQNAEHNYKTRLPDVFKIAGALEKVHKSGRSLLRG